MDCFPRDTNGFDEAIVLPRPPFVSVSSVKYTPYNAATVTISAADYQVDLTADAHGFPREARILPAVGKMWPSDTLRVMKGVEVRFVSGYGVDPLTVPEQIRLAIKQLVALWYRNRDSIGCMPEHVANVLTGSVGGYAFV